MKFSLLIIPLALVVNVAEGYICPCGWQFYFGNGNCYLFSYKAKHEWAVAMAVCRRYGGYLVKVNNLHEHNWLRNSAKKINHVIKNKRFYWIGASDFHYEGHWKWSIDNTDVKVNGWFPGQPDNAGKSQHCALMRSRTHYSWEDQRCSDRLDYICERPAFGKPACTCIF